MKSTLSVIALVVVVASFVVYQAMAKSGQGGNVEQSLMQLEQQMADALMKGDTATIDRHMADTFTFTAPDGMVQNKAQVLADVKSGDLKMTSTKYDDMKVQTYGDAAVVTYRSTDQGTYKGQDISGQYRWTDVFVKKGGQWQVVAGHGTPLARK
jgi:ketosteroid isomerase-like protein